MWIVIIVVIALMVVWNWLLRMRTRRIARGRAGEGFSDFVFYFAGKNIPHEILTSTYQFFEDWNADAAGIFPVRATDDIADIYGIAGEDLYDGIDEILEKSGRRWFRENEQQPPSPFKTVEDVVLYVAAAPSSLQ